MMNGFPEIHIYPLIIAIILSCFLFLMLCIFIARFTREKLQLQNRIKRLNDGENQVTLKQQDVKKKNPKSQLPDLQIMNLFGEKLLLAGIMLKPNEFLSIWIAFVVFPALIGLIITFNGLVAAGLGILGGIGPAVYIKIKHGKRMDLFNNQLGDSLNIMSNCLKSGLSFGQAMMSISKEMPDPIAKEFGRVLREVKFGSTIEDALNGMVQRIKSKDLELMVSAILIQRQVGGNLSEILNNISSTIANRIKIKNEIKVMTSTGRLSGIIVGVLPIGVSLIIMILNPGYFEVFLHTKLGWGLLALCAVMEAIGFAFIFKIVKVEY